MAGIGDTNVEVDDEYEKKINFLEYEETLVSAFSELITVFKALNLICAYYVFCARVHNCHFQGVNLVWFCSSSLLL